MDWPKGTKVKCNIFPDIYTIDGPAAVNEIGYKLVPVISAKGERAYLHPHNIIVVLLHHINKSLFVFKQKSAVGT